MQKKTVLLVEDDELLRRSLKIVLETSYDFKVIDMPNGMHAIRMLSEKKPHIDAAILDIVMPGHGGSVRDYLRKTPEYRNMLITYYTGLDQEEIDNKILEGAYYINKEKGSVKQVGEILKRLLG